MRPQLSLSLCLLATSIVQTSAVTRKRRRLRQTIGNDVEVEMRSEQEDLEVVKGEEEEEEEESLHANANTKKFYDLEGMKEEEKLSVIRAAYTITSRSNDIDWDTLEANFMSAAKRSASASQSRSQSGGSGSSRRSGSSSSGDSDSDVADNEENANEENDNESFFQEPVNSSNNAITKSTGNQARQTQRIWFSSMNKNIHDFSQTKKVNRAVNDQDVFGGYEYAKGNCPDDGSLGVPCAPDNLEQLCNKYDRTNGSFKDCMLACAPSICCIHDADPQLNTITPNCNADENCDGYNICYIAWWKLHDTVGPALFLRVQQDDDFYDLENESFSENYAADPFFTQLLLHHWDDIQIIITAGTVDNEFDASRVFLDEDFWRGDF